MPQPKAPVARALSPLLTIGQWVCAVIFILFVLAAAFMAFPSGVRETLLNNAPSSIDPSTLMVECLAGAVVVVGWFFVLKLLQKVVMAVVHGDPFLPENITRLRNIWIIFAVTEVFRMLTFFALIGSKEAEGIAASEPRLDIRLGTWFFIFVIIAISEAFRHGAALRAEQELTI